MQAFSAAIRSSCGLGAVLRPRSSKGSSASMVKARCTSCPPIVYDVTDVRLRVCPLHSERTRNSTWPLAGSWVMSRTTSARASTSSPFTRPRCVSTVAIGVASFRVGSVSRRVRRRQGKRCAVVRLNQIGTLWDRRSNRRIGRFSTVSGSRRGEVGSTPMASVGLVLGDSAAIVAVREQISRLLRSAGGPARRLPPILILGETGTGKGLLASAIHRSSARAAGPFVDVNCSAIPDTLLEAELFGFERGAFTDARQAKAGLFQAANGGTLFLDEVGLLPLAMQAKLLKVLEERSVRRLGSTRSEPVDVF